MRVKAENSLKRLKAMKTKKRKHLIFTDVDQETWTQCKVDKMFGSNYIKMLDWTNKNTDGFHSRSDESFWFEDPRDAFKFKLKFGETDGQK